MTGPAAIAFPGQGGDWSATVATLVDHADHPLVRALADRLGTDRWADLDGGDTRAAQPAIYVAGLVGPTAGQRPTVLAMGHSLGEITAAACAGAIEAEAGLDLMVARGELGHATHAERPGAMVAVNRWNHAEVEWLRRTIVGDGASGRGGVLDVAVVNSPTQVVLSGDLALVEEATRRANETGAVARRLPIGGAYHSSLMAPVVDGFRRRVAAAVTAEPAVPVLSSTLQWPMTTVDDLVDGLSRALVLPVDWPATVAAASATGATGAVEGGPGDTLRRLARFAPDLAITDP